MVEAEHGVEAVTFELDVLNACREPEAKVDDQWSGAREVS